MLKSIRRSSVVRKLFGHTKSARFRRDQSAILAENIQGKRTVTLYLNMHSSDKAYPEPLVETPDMAKHIVVSETNRVGICGFSRGFNSTEQFKYVSSLRKHYAQYKDSAMEGNSEYFIKFSRGYMFQYASDKMVPSVREAHQDLDEETYEKTILPEYRTRALLDNPGKSQRVYHTNKSWSTNNNTKDESMFTMGMYIVGMHHCPQVLERRLKDIYYDYEAYSFPRIPPEHPGISEDFFGMFNSLQTLNLMNVAVSERLAEGLGIQEVPLGTEPSETTGILRYKRTTLTHILKYFKDLGFDYVNIVDASCRYTEMDYTNPEEVAQVRTLLRQQSKRETDDYANAEELGLLRRTSKTLGRKKYRRGKRLQTPVYTRRKSSSP
jgi:hypothetical protein